MPDKGSIKKSMGYFTAAALLLTVVYSPLLYDKYQLAKAVAYFLPLLFLLAFSALFPPRLKSSLTLLFFLAYLGYMSLRLLFSACNPQVHYAALFMAPAGMLIPVLSGFGAGNAKKIAVISALLTACASALGFYQLAAGLPRPYSFFGNPIFFGEFIALLFMPSMLAFYFFPVIRPLAPSFAVIAATAAFTASSRGALFALAVSGFFMLFLLRRTLTGFSLRGLFRQNIPGIAAACFALLVLMLLPGVRESVQSGAGRFLSSFSAGPGALMNRSLMAKASVDMIKDAPLFGHGAGSVRCLYQKYQSRYLDASPGGYEFVNTSYIHNDYLHLSAESGMAGLLLFILFTASLFRFFDLNAALMGRDSYIFSLSCVSALAASLAESFVNFPLFSFPSAALFFLFAGMLYSLSAEIGGARTYVPAVAVRSVSVILLLLIAAVFSPKKLLSDFYLQKGYTELERRTNFQDMYFGRALELDPHSYYPRFYLGYSAFINSDFAGSASYYAKALDVYPYSADLMYNIASSNFALGSLEEAAAWYKKSLALYPGFVPALVSLGKIYVMTGMEKEGLELIAAASRLNPLLARSGSSAMVVDFRETTYEIK